MKYWITTDTHFFHDKMLKYCGRPHDFERIIFKGLLQLKPDDVLIHLGDICIGHDERAHNRFIKTLPCKKWLVKGNHDTKSDVWYLNHGWDFVGTEILLKRFGKRILLTHRPAQGGSYDINVHGHCHNGTHHDEELNNNRNKLFALEYNNYQPMRLGSFVEGV